MLTREQIKQYLPHREPMLLLDNVEEWSAGEHLCAHYTFKADDRIFEGHFPNFPIVPGVLQIEALAQAAGLLVNLTTEKTAAETLFLFLGIEQAKFKRKVLPDEPLRLSVKLEKTKRDLYWFSGEACVGDEVSATAQFTAKHVKL